MEEKGKRKQNKITTAKKTNRTRPRSGIRCFAETQKHGMGSTTLKISWSAKAFLSKPLSEFWGCHRPVALQSPGIPKTAFKVRKKAILDPREQWPQTSIQMSKQSSPFFGDLVAFQTQNRSVLATQFHKSHHCPRW